MLPAVGWPGAAVAGSLAPAAAPELRQVHYRGVTFAVPAAWPVLDLASDPSRCVRFDQPAVYLGHQGPNAQCPARVIGRDDAIQVEPLDAGSASRAARATANSAVNGEPAKLHAAAAVEGETLAVFSRRSVLVTVSHRQGSSIGDQVLKSFTFGGAAAPAASPTPPVAAPVAIAPAAVAQFASPAVRVGTVVTGEAFDTCAAPSEATMAAWVSSPYRSVGVYIGGINRGCSQPNLTATWLADEANQGWSFIPIYVGLQAPCNSFAAIFPAQARVQGVGAADDAVAHAGALGMAQGSALYFDMEGYDTTAPGCSQAVLDFLYGWTAELHAANYLSGVYSSSASGVTDLAKNYNNAAYNTPDDIWFANWSCCPHSVVGDRFFSDSLWSPHRRLHQYSGGHLEIWGGVQINIDADYTDGALVGGIPGYTLDAWGGLHNFGGAPFVYSTGYWPGRDLARGLALRPPGQGGGYVLDDWGGIHPFGGAPFVYGTSYWPNWDIARGIAINPCDPTGNSGYVLDGSGGIHPFGGAPAVFGTGYWPGWDIARGLAMRCVGGSPGGYTVDGHGGVHSIGSAPALSGGGYWPNADLATGVAMAPNGGGYVLDAWGGITPFGPVAPLLGSAYWPGTRTARGIALGSSGLGGYVGDVNGGVHYFGRASPLNVAPFGGSLGRGIAVSG